MPSSVSESSPWPVSDALLTVPIRYHNGHIYLRARPGSCPAAWFILDSGSSTSMLDELYAARVGQRATGSLPAKGIGGYEEVRLVAIDTVHISELVLTNMTAGILDLSFFRSSAPDSGAFGGILGYDFLARFPIEIDFQKETLTLYDPARYSLQPGGVEVPFHLTMQIPTVAGELVGKPGRFLVDLGNPFELILHKGFAADEALLSRLEDIQELPEAIGGIGGLSPGRSARATVFKLGDAEIAGVNVLLADSEEGIAGSRQIAGNVGNLLLERFRVHLDYQSSRLILYPADTIR